MEIDNESVLHNIVEVQKKLLESGANIKLIERSSIHITVKFLGNITETQEEVIINQLKGMNYDPIDITLTNIGVFQSINRISIIWVGIDKVAKKKIIEIATEIENRLENIVESNDKEFSPHLTIARVKSVQNIDLLKEILHEVQSEEFGRDSITEIKLKKSFLTPSGPIYTDLYSVQLKEK